MHNDTTCNVHINEESIKQYIGESKLKEFFSAATALDDPINRLRKKNINIHISATAETIKCELKNNDGESILTKEHSKRNNLTPLNIFNNAILNGFYIINKDISYAIDLIKS
ncbi:MAG: hypothetical protein AB7V50_11190 [Vampirovibrionia bacterium]